MINEEALLQHALIGCQGMLLLINAQMKEICQVLESGDFKDFRAIYQPGPEKRHLSDEARAKIRVAQRERWARIHAKQESMEKRMAKARAARGRRAMTRSVGA